MFLPNAVRKRDMICHRNDDTVFKRFMEATVRGGSCVRSECEYSCILSLDEVPAVDRIRKARRDSHRWVEPVHIGSPFQGFVLECSEIFSFHAETTL